MDLIFKFLSVLFHFRSYHYNMHVDSLMPVSLF